MEFGVEAEVRLVPLFLFKTSLNSFSSTCTEELMVELLTFDTTGESVSSGLWLPAP